MTSPEKKVWRLTLRGASGSTCHEGVYALPPLYILLRGSLSRALATDPAWAGRSLEPGQGWLPLSWVFSAQLLLSGSSLGTGEAMPPSIHSFINVAIS